MTRDSRQKSEYESGGELDREDEVEAVEEELDEGLFEQPYCPRCGWHNTRPSHTYNAIDALVRMLGMRPYRCRSCGNRFRAMRRVRKG